MFRKLLKYEWQANAKLIWILSLAALGVALLGGCVLCGANFIVRTNPSDVVIAMVVPGMYVLFGFCCFAVAGYVVAVEIINLVRFYKNKFTDEGYLTFTLPVTSQQIYLSTFVNILLWMLITTAIAVVCFILMFSIGLGDTLRELMEDVTWQYLLEQLSLGLGEFQQELDSIPGYRLYSVLMTIMVVISPLYAVSLVMGCLTLGSVLVKKHKILASIGIYYGATMVMNTVTSTASGFLTLSTMNMDNFFVAYNTTAVFQILLSVGVIVGGYFLSTHLMKNKLNLS